MDSSYQGRTDTRVVELLRMLMDDALDDMRDRKRQVDASFEPPPVPPPASHRERVERELRSLGLGAREKRKRRKSLHRKRR